MSGPSANPVEASSPPRRWPLLPTLILVVLLGFTLFGDRGLLRALQFHRQQQALQQELAELERTNSELRREIESLRSDRRYLEGIARKELGMVKQDELVYQFPAPASPSPTPR